MDILLSEVNSFQNIERAERSFTAADYEVPDDRKIFAQRADDESNQLGHLKVLLETRFDWGADL